jgi:terminase small subunit / prophage DNA-packing protein
MNKKATDIAGSASKLADLLGVPPKAIPQLAATGVVVRATSRGSYLMMASVESYCGHFRRSASGREAPLALARRRLLGALADLAETRARAESGALVDAARVEAGWSALCRSTMASTMAILSRVAASQPHLSRGDLREIDDVLRQKLNAAADDADESDEISFTPTPQETRK